MRPYALAYFQPQWPSLKCGVACFRFVPTHEVDQGIFRTEHIANANVFMGGAPIVSNFAQTTRCGYAIRAAPGFCKPTRGWEAAARDTD